MGGTRRSYRISTATRGIGNVRDSLQTPGGELRVKLKIGSGLPQRSIFVGRRATGNVLTAEMQEKSPHADWILTRILWLEGSEKGVNRGGDVDTLRRYIYIHGTAEEECLGMPASHGCIRMANGDIEELFELISVGDRVRVQV
ncbi:L,D-transpeptidase [Achromobacter spanius]|nr:L,D-transpeptidase [Achromobacter spanius]